MTDQAALAPAAPRYLRPARQSRADEAPVREESAPKATAPRLLALFLLILLLPLNFSLGGLSLTPIRVLLLIAFVPLFFRWVTGAAGRVTTGDILIAFHCLWIALALIALHGPERVPYAGITVVEIFGSYLLGRMLIRNGTDYRLYFRYFLLVLIFLAPFVVVEMVTSKLVISEILGKVAATHPKLQTDPDQMRKGFYRAQAVLEHPILWGLFCSMGIANIFYIFRERFFRSVILSGFVTGMTFTSLSSGPLLAAATQIGIIGWGWITRNAWWVLICLAVLGYIVIDLISNRTPVQVLITYLTFNSGSAYWRLHIWTYGSAEALRHPLFGIGLNDWTRPDWMGTASVDNFWLLTAMRYGLPAILFLIGGVIANLVQILRQKDLSGPDEDLRRGHVIAMIGTAMTLGTVHAWGSAIVFVMFYFGAGAWIFTGGAGTAAATAAAPAEGSARGSTRAARAGTSGDRGPVAVPQTDADPHPHLPAVAARNGRGGPTEAERLARRRAQYSGGRERAPREPDRRDRQK